MKNAQIINKKILKKILLVISLIVFILLLLPIFGLAYLSMTSPKPSVAGIVDGRLSTCPSSPNCVCSFDDDKKHTIDPIHFEGDPREVFSHLKEELKKMTRAKIVTAEENYLHCEFTSLIFRYVDDVELLLMPEEKLIHVRSASRAGHSDFNVNRKRVELIRTLIH